VKLLDIWERGGTFPAALLAGFKQKLNPPTSNGKIPSAVIFDEKELFVLIKLLMCLILCSSSINDSYWVPTKRLHPTNRNEWEYCCWGSHPGYITDPEGSGRDG